MQVSADLHSGLIEFLVDNNRVSDSTASTAVLILVSTWNDCCTATSNYLQKCLFRQRKPVKLAIVFEALHGHGISEEPVDKRVVGLLLLCKQLSHEGFSFGNTLDCPESWNLRPWVYRRKRAKTSWQSLHSSFNRLAHVPTGLFLKIKDMV